MAVDTIKEWVRLTNTTPGHNKAYTIQLVGDDADGYAVKALYGPIGNETRVAWPQKNRGEFAVAAACFTKTKQAKLKDHYVVAGGSREGTGTAPDPVQEVSRDATGVFPMLLNPLDEAELDACLADPAYVMQQKFDGERLLLDIADGTGVRGSNRKGFARGVPQWLVEAAAGTSKGGLTRLDGEIMPDGYRVFDAQWIDGTDIRRLPWSERNARLAALADRCAGAWRDRVELVNSFMGTAAQRMALDTLCEMGREGVVFKRIDSAYVEGVPASGGAWRKYKFTESATARVAASNEGKGKRSIVIELHDEAGAWSKVGNVTIPANVEVPAVGAIVEVSYLYVARKGGSLYQPQYKGVRNDQDATDCDFAQLKYRDQPRAVDPQEAVAA